jgi:hypothetical protein
MVVSKRESRHNRRFVAALVPWHNVGVLGEHWLQLCSSRRRVVLLDGSGQGEKTLARVERGSRPGRLPDAWPGVLLAPAPSVAQTGERRARPPFSPKSGPGRQLLGARLAFFLARLPNDGGVLGQNGESRCRLDCAPNLSDGMTSLVPALPHLCPRRVSNLLRCRWW